MTVRALLHPVAPTAALAVAAPAVAVGAGRAAGVILLLVAGFAAGFANSGST